MGTIADKLTYLNATKVMLRDALMSSGARLTNASPFRDYVAAISFAQRTLDLDFARNAYKVLSAPTLVSKNFTDLITFTRASGGGRFNHLGQYEWLAANDTPRFGFDPATVSASTSSVAIGAGQLTFAVTRQYALGEIVRATADASNYLVGKVTAATASSVTLLVDSDGFTGSGTFSSWTLIVSRGLLIEEQRTNLLLNSATLATQSLNLTAGTYTMSFYGSGTVSLSGAYSGTVVGSGASTRKTFSFTATAGTLTLTVSGSCTSGQLEAGKFPTSYIPTTSAQVTRAADVPSVNTLGPWYNHSEWTIVAEFDVIADTPANQFVASLGSTAGSTDWFLSGSSAAGQVATNYMTSAYIGAAPVARSRKVAVAYSAAGLAMSLDGGAVMSDATVTPMSSTPTKLNLGYATSPGGPLNGHIKSFRYYPKRLTNAELQAVST